MAAPNFDPASILWVFLDLGSTLIDETVPTRLRAKEIAQTITQSGQAVSAADVIQALQIASYEYRAGTQARLAALGWDKHIRVCIASAEAGVEKPDSAIYKLALESASCEPSEAVMVGDRLDNDIRPAKAIGMRTIRVLQGFHRVQVPRDASEEADLTIATVVGLGRALWT